MTDVALPRRTIRSYVLRQGRITKSQEQALEALLPQYGLKVENGLLDWTSLFGHEGSRVIEIGFGMGESLLTMAMQAPETHFIGIEVHAPGVGHLLKKMEAHGVKNLRVYQFDAVEVLARCIPNNSIDRLQIYFPDPWHKKAHHKRRIIQPDFIELVVEKLATNGQLHIATDWQHYAEHMLTIINENRSLSNMSVSNTYIERPTYRPITKFEQRGERLGHAVFDLLYAKI